MKPVRESESLMSSLRVYAIDGIVPVVDTTAYVHPSAVLMGDAGSRALGFYTGMCVMVSGNPFLFLATSSIIFVNGGMGLLKVALKRFFHISIFENIRFPLHDHMRKNHGWSPTQVLIKFMIMQLLITVAMLGIFFKVR